MVPNATLAQESAHFVHHLCTTDHNLRIQSEIHDLAVWINKFFLIRLVWITSYFRGITSPRNSMAQLPGESTPSANRQWTPRLRRYHHPRWAAAELALVDRHGLTEGPMMGPEGGATGTKTGTFVPGLFTASSNAHVRQRR